MTLVFVGGYAGAGKSTFGRLLASKTTGALLDKDTLTRPLVERLCEELGSGPHDRESATYQKVVRPLEYSCMLAAIEDNLVSGQITVAVAPWTRDFRSPGWGSAMKELAAAYDHSCLLAWVSTTPGIMHSRLATRNAPRDRQKLRDWAAYSANLNTSVPEIADVVIDNGPRATPLEDQAEDLARMITTSRPAESAP